MSGLLSPLLRGYTTFLKLLMDYLEQYYSLPPQLLVSYCSWCLTLQSLPAMRSRSSLCPLPSCAFCHRKDKEEEEKGFWSSCAYSLIQQCMDCNANTIYCPHHKEGQDDRQEESC